MPRKSREECPESFFQITNRCINKEWFTNSMPQVFEIFTTHLNFYAKAMNVEIVNFVLMSNHYHLLARFPDGNRSLFMYYFSREVGRDLRKPSRRVNRTWGNRYHSSRVSPTEHSLRAVYKYNYANPLKAGICKRAEEYPYSTLQFLLGNRKCKIPVHYDPIFNLNTIDEYMDWINELPEEREWEQVAAQLKMPNFKPPRTKTRRPIRNF